MGCPPMATVLSVGPAADTQALSDFFFGSGLCVQQVDMPEDACVLVSRGAASLVVIQAGLPRDEGLRLVLALRALRAQATRVPILSLCEHVDVDERITWLDAGADACMTWPCHLREVVAQARALMRRPHWVHPDASVWRSGALEIRLDSRQVWLDGRLCDFTACEVDILCELARHPGVAVSRVHLIERLWGRGAGVYGRSVDAHICRIRARIERDPRDPVFVRTVRGVGYSLTRSKD